MRILESLFLIIFGTIFILFHKSLAKAIASYWDEVLKIKSKPQYITFLKFLAILVGSIFLVTGILTLMGIIELKG